MSEPLFRSRVDDRTYPPGYVDGGIRCWLKDDLDDFIDRACGIAAKAELDDADPFVAPVTRGKCSSLSAD